MLAAAKIKGIIYSTCECWAAVPVAMLPPHNPSPPSQRHTSSLSDSSTAFLHRPFTSPIHPPNTTHTPIPTALMLARGAPTQDLPSGAQTCPKRNLPCGPIGSQTRTEWLAKGHPSYGIDECGGSPTVDHRFSRLRQRALHCSDAGACSLTGDPLLALARRSVKLTLRLTPNNRLFNSSCCFRAIMRLVRYGGMVVGGWPTEQWGRFLACQRPS
ncbi:hypothetical protein BU23DRAFT_316122 [Bimuria novae-zelandiae CBS 107.79]|uniref:Uncharacterized protein n=1 Tax=Bimuria novae-zelandiae CBS 107.79 TaxID=1447943 RepID=A0A6A5UPE2_9PLEO|nr:hypothetical protein BU23DRAFT_316122 [Bimuria novae-zelandiae CBS 107.79]